MAWVQIHVRDEIMLAFTYQDEQAGPSAKGTIVRPESLAEDARRAAERPDQTVRLERSFFPMTELPPDAIARLGLPAEPEWMSFFGGGTPQPWRSDPALAGRFHPDLPDDLEVSFFLENAVEKMWVRTTGVDDAVGGYKGELLNQPFAEASGLAQGASLTYRVAKGAPDPVWVSPVVRANLEHWTSECGTCGFDLLLEPAEAIAARQFDTGLETVAFTTRCPMCGGGMLVERRR
jgi:hypothetical protein